MLLGSKAVVFMPFFRENRRQKCKKEVLKEPTYVEELLTLFRSNLGKKRTARKNLRLS